MLWAWPQASNNHSNVIFPGTHSGSHWLGLSWNTQEFTDARHCDMLINVCHYELFLSTGLQVSNNNRHSAALIVISGEGHQKFWPNVSFRSSLFCRRDIGETKMLKSKLRQHATASPTPELRKTEACNYYCQNTHEDRVNCTLKWQLCVRAQARCESCIWFQLFHTPVLQWFAVKANTPVEFLLSSTIWNQTVSPQGLKRYHAIISTQIWIKAYLRMLFKKVGIKF